MFKKFSEKLGQLYAFCLRLEFCTHVVNEVDGMIILRWVFRKWEGVVGTGWSGLRIGRGGGHL
jgi:hypothetical protein